MLSGIQGSEVQPPCPGPPRAHLKEAVTERERLIKQQAHTSFKREPSKMQTAGNEWWNQQQQHPHPQQQDARIPIDVVLSADDEAQVLAAESFARMPSLALPFAAFGAFAGLFAILAVGSFRSAAHDVSPITPSVVTGLIGALAGAALQRWRTLHQPPTIMMRMTRESQILRVGLVTALAGAASGGMIGILTWGADGFIRFAGGGFIVGILFLPSALVVFDAARRAGRGRHGSLVAATDRRTVFSTVLGGIAFAAATQVPALLNLEVSNDFEPLGQAVISFGVSLGALLGIIQLQLRDRKARAALEGFKNDAAWLDRVSSEDDIANNPHEQKAAPVDLGIGADKWTKTTDNNYRNTGRPDVLVQGSISEAAKAFDECVVRRHRSLMVAAASLSAITVSFLVRVTEYF
jgi:hypothetical protein